MNKNELPSLYSKDAVWEQGAQINYSGGREKLEIGYEAVLVQVKNNNWYVSFKSDPDDTVEVSPEIGRMLVVSIEAEKRIRRKYRFQRYDPTMSKSHLVDSWFSRLYCHNIIAYMLGFRGSGFRSGKGFTENFDANNSKHFQSIDLLKQAIPSDFPVIGRVYGYPKHMDKTCFHTFAILGKTKSGRYITFEKTNSGTFPIRIASLEDVYKTYLKNEFEFLPASAIKVNE